MPVICTSSWPPACAAESRGTALCYLQIGLPDAGVLNERYGEAGYAEILRAIAGRLQQLVRGC